MPRTDKEDQNKYKASSNKVADSTKKTTKKKKKKVIISHISKPEMMTLEEWQVKLRQQASKSEHFIISSVDEEVCPGEYVVRNLVVCKV